MSPEERGLLDDVLDHPDEDGPRLIYADWLEDAERIEQAAFIRGEVRSGQKPWSHKGPFRNCPWLPDGVLCYSSRGFIDTVCCKQDIFLSLAGRLFDGHSVRVVGLTDVMPCPMGDESNLYFWPVISSHDNSKPLAYPLWRRLRLARYQTAEEAQEGLSAACVAYGQDLRKKRARTTTR